MNYSSGMTLQEIKNALDEISEGTDFSFMDCELADGMISTYMYGDNPCGEDWEEEITIPAPDKKEDLRKSLTAAIKTIRDNFDIEDNVVMWLDAKRHGIGGVPNVVELVHNEEYKENALEEFYEKLMKD